MNDTAPTGGATSSLPVALVATVFNEADNIARFAASVLAQSRRPDEVVIVDGGSIDGTPEAIRRELGGRVDLRLIVEPGLNISQGRNRAIAEARCPVIACSDAGCVLRPEWLARLTAALERDDGVAVASGFYAMDCRSLLQTCVGLSTMPGQLEPVDPQKFLPSSRSVAFRKSAWQAAGGYPEWLYTAEDTLFDMKLKALGFRFEFVSDAVVEWAPRRTWRSVARQFYLYARGRGHLGTGGEALSWMAKRLAAAVVIAAGGLLLWWPLWLLLPALVLYDHFWLVHPVARRVQNKCGDARAYPVTSAVLWLVRLARSAGCISGTIQRRRDRRRFVDNLNAYMADAGGWPPKSPLAGDNQR